MFSIICICVPHKTQVHTPKVKVTIGSQKSKLATFELDPEHNSAFLQMDFFLWSISGWNLKSHASLMSSITSRSIESKNQIPTSKVKMQVHTPKVKVTIGGQKSKLATFELDPEHNSAIFKYFADGFFFSGAYLDGI